MAASNPWHPERLRNCTNSGVDFGLPSKSKMVSTDTSNPGWSVLCYGRPAFSTLSGSKLCWHNNCVEMMVVRLALKSFLPDLRDQPCPDGGRIHKPLKRPEIAPEIVPSEQMVSLFLLWAQHNLQSMRVVHMLGRLNQCADMLSWSGVTHCGADPRVTKRELICLSSGGPDSRFFWWLHSGRASHGSPGWPSY